MAAKTTKAKAPTETPKLMQVRLTPEQVDEALTAYSRQLLVGQWDMKVLHMHKTGGVTLEATYTGIGGHASNHGSRIFVEGRKGEREPILSEELRRSEEAESELGHLMEGGGEMVEL